MTASAPLVEIRGLTKRFGGLTAVDGLDFDLYPGEILGVIGPNGAGKSTTFNVIAGTYAADAGSVIMDGADLLGLAPHEIAARGVMRTFQHNMPFEGMSVLDNVLVGAHTRLRSGLLSILAGTRSARHEEEEARRRAADTIAFVGLEEFRHVGVSALSFGQGRLLETARALAGEPRVMLFDEPAAGLTPRECDRLGEIIKGIAARGISVLLIEHDMRFLLPLAERVIVLNFGRKIADGPSHLIRENKAVIDAYLGEPMATARDGAPGTNEGGGHAAG